MRRGETFYCLSDSLPFKTKSVYTRRESERKREGGAEHFTPSRDKP